MQERDSAVSRYGSPNLDKLVERLSSTSDPRKRYEYVLWLAKKLPEMPQELQTEERKVQGCVSQVFVDAKLVDGSVQWKGASDALITKGLLALLIQGLSDLSPDQVQAVDPSFIAATGLQASLTPSRANGFLNILRMMQAQAAQLSRSSDPTAA
ncbi:SufE family protein [Synechococcus sp. WH 8101]|jgi:cysteine desulfuration protein SufE|uniref:SufE family protein n=1 Tax=Synechococcus sp. WH 8101 TaxID=59932 RepID=UPI001022BDB0|nr:SufE family protein [Synechococcus sp. WH 8101]QBE68458.1 SufE family protein [Synechococcus sp. WH 8101]QNI44672.1 sulfur acceptor for SufS cysteine desulfurase [Synechococcus sp. WH 8101]